MVLVDRVYKVSVFGEFESIQPDPETMLSFMQHFGANGFVPSLYVEVLAGPNGAIQKNRVALVTNTGDRKITIGSSRIDIEFIQNEDAQFSMEEREVFNRFASETIEYVFSNYSKASNRLAINTESLLIDLSDKMIESFSKRFTTPISIYGENPLKEWSIRLVTKKQEKINDKTEQFNIITAIKKTVLQKTKDDQPVLADGFSISGDLNTAGENQRYRFDSHDLSSFLKVVNSWLDCILKDIGDGI